MQSLYLEIMGSSQTEYPKGATRMIKPVEFKASEKKSIVQVHVWPKVVLSMCKDHKNDVIETILQIKELKI